MYIGNTSEPKVRPPAPSIVSLPLVERVVLFTVIFALPVSHGTMLEAVAALGYRTQRIAKTRMKTKPIDDLETISTSGDGSIEHFSDGLFQE